MNSITVPEVILYNTLTSIVTMLKEDCINNLEKDTILYNLFGKDEQNDLQPLQINTFNYLTQGIEIFKNKEISVNIGYNLSVLNEGLGIHIILPNEQGKPLTIGADEGYQPNDVDLQEFTYSANKTLSMSSTYNIMLTSANSSEVVLIYNALRAIMLVLNDHLEISGLKNFAFGGSDVIIQQEYIPANIFHRNINVTFEYEITSTNIFVEQIINKFKFKAVILNN